MSDWHDFTRNLITDFRTNLGRVTSGPFEGRQVLLLTTVGAKTGTIRTTPLVYTTDGANWVIVASKGGADTHPAWYLNLLANPNATIEVAGETVPILATPARRDERRRLYDLHGDLHASFKEYELKTSREIPVLVLSRTNQPGPQPIG
jgi:deazaflavin-dependent oxidoreductase (nitroreductase family)